MLHVRQGRRQRVPRLRRPHPPGGRPAAGAGRPGPEAVLLPPDDPLPRRVDRRGPSLRLMKILAIPDRGFLSKGLQVNMWADGESDACIVTGIVLIAVGVLVTPLLCGAGFLLLVIGAVMW